MKKLTTGLMLAFGLVVLIGCNPGNRIARVTPLPTNQSLTRSPNPTLTPVPTRPSLIPSATPRQVNLPEGHARQVALATDTAMRPTPRSAVTFEDSPVALAFSEFYDGYSIRSGLILSDKLLSLDGREVTIEGYMAPPLKPELDYFVLTRIRLAFCPFCSTAADWPDDIALVYMPPGEPTVATTSPIRLTARLEVGASIDLETGMVSLVRLYATRLEVIH